MRKWLEDLAQNEVVLKRIEHVLNHTLSDEDGGVYPSIEDAAEVFGLLFVAYTVGLDDLGSTTRLEGKSTEDSTMGRIEMGRVSIDEEHDRFEFKPTINNPADLRIELY